MGSKDIVEVNEYDGNPKLITKKVTITFNKLDFARKRKDVKSKLMDRVSESNNNLTQNLKNLKSVTNCQKEKEGIKTITCLVKEMENIQYQLQTEKAYLVDLKEQIRQTDVQKSSDIIKRKRSTTIKNGCLLSRDSKLVERAKGIWEGKLHMASVDLSNTIARNAELREKNRLLMIERKNFNKEYHKLLEKLKNGKIIIEDLVLTIRNAFLIRQTILKKLEQIDLKAKKQMGLQDQEMLDLQMRSESEHMWKNFYLNKTRQRLEEAIQNKMRRMTMKEKTISEQIGKRKLLLEEILQTTMSEGGSIEIAEYETVIDNIKKDNREVASLFNHATQLNNELEALKEQVAQQERQITETTLTLEEKNILHIDEMRFLVSFKKNIEESKFNFDDEVLSSHREVNKLFKGVENLIDISKADVSHLLLLLGENNKVTQFNYKLFLQALETKLISVMDVLNLPRNLVSSLYTKERKSSESQKNGDIARFANIVADKVVITVPCAMCYGPKFNSKVSILQNI